MDIEELRVLIAGDMTALNTAVNEARQNAMRAAQDVSTAWESASRAASSAGASVSTGMRQGTAASKENAAAVNEATEAARRAEIVARALGEAEGQTATATKAATEQMERFGVASTKGAQESQAAFQQFVREEVAGTERMSTAQKAFNLELAKTKLELQGLQYGTKGTGDFRAAQLGLQYPGVSSGQIAQKVEAEEQIAAMRRQQAAAGKLGGAALSGTANLAGVTTGLGIIAAIDFTQVERDLIMVRNNTMMTNQEFDLMKQKVLAMAKETGAPIKELAEGWMHVANFEFQGADAAKILTAANEAARATGASTATTAQLLAKVLRENNMEATQAAKVMNVLTYAAAGSDAKLADLVERGGRVFAMAAQLGVHFQETAGAMSIFMARGVNAAQATTQLQNILSHIIKPTNDVQNVIKGLGENGRLLAEDFTLSGLKTKQLSGIFEDIRTTARNAGIPVNELAARLFPGLRGTIGGLIGTSDSGFNGLLDRLGRMGKLMSGELDDNAAKFKVQQESSAAAIDRLVRTIQVDLLPAGEKFVKLFHDMTPIIESGIGVIQKGLDIFLGLPKPVKEAAIALGVFRIATMALGNPMGGMLGTGRLVIKMFGDLEVAAKSALAANAGGGLLSKAGALGGVTATSGLGSLGVLALGGLGVYEFHKSKAEEVEAIDQQGDEARKQTDYRLLGMQQALAGIDKEREMAIKLGDALRLAELEEERARVWQRGRRWLGLDKKQDVMPPATKHIEDVLGSKTENKEHEKFLKMLSAEQAKLNEAMNGGDKAAQAFKASIRELTPEHQRQVLALHEQAIAINKAAEERKKHEEVEKRFAAAQELASGNLKAALGQEKDGLAELRKEYPGVSEARLKALADLQKQIEAVKEEADTNQKLTQTFTNLKSELSESTGKFDVHRVAVDLTGKSYEQLSDRNRGLINAIAEQKRAMADTKALDEWKKKVSDAFDKIALMGMPKSARGVVDFVGGLDVWRQLNPQLQKAAEHQYALFNQAKMVSDSFDRMAQHAGGYGAVIADLRNRQASLRQEMAQSVFDQAAAESRMQSLREGGLGLSAIEGAKGYAAQIQSARTRQERIAAYNRYQGLVNETPGLGEYLQAEMASNRAETQIKQTQLELDKANNQLREDLKILHQYGIEAGGDLISGLATGLTDPAKLEQLKAQAVGLAEQAVKTIKDHLEIKSPSQVFYRIGQDVGTGLAQGITATQGTVGNAVNTLSESLRKSALAKFSDAVIHAQQSEYAKVSADFVRFGGGGKYGAGANLVGLDAINRAEETRMRKEIMSGAFQSLSVGGKTFNLSDFQSQGKAGPQISVVQNIHGDVNTEANADRMSQKIVNDVAKTLRFAMA